MHRLWGSGINFDAGAGVVKTGGGQMFVSLLYRDSCHLVLFTMSNRFIVTVSNQVCKCVAGLCLLSVWTFLLQGLPDICGWEVLPDPSGKCPVIISKLATTVSSFIVPDFTFHVLMAIVLIVLWGVTPCSLVAGYWCFLVCHILFLLARTWFSVLPFLWIWLAAFLYHVTAPLTLKMEATCFPEMSVSAYHIARCHNQQDSSLRKCLMEWTLWRIQVVWGPNWLAGWLTQSLTHSHTHPLSPLKECVGEASRLCASQRIPHFLWNPKLHYHADKSLLLVCVLSQMSVLSWCTYIRPSSDFAVCTGLLQNWVWMAYGRTRNCNKRSKYSWCLFSNMLSQQLIQLCKMTE